MYMDSKLYEYSVEKHDISTTLATTNMFNMPTKTESRSCANCI